MTKQRAIQILITHAAKNVAGSGCGIRESVTDENTKLVTEAIRKVWRMAYSWPITSTDLRNLGIYS